MIVVLILTDWKEWRTDVKGRELVRRVVSPSAFFSSILLSYAFLAGSKSKLSFCLLIFFSCTLLSLFLSSISTAPFSIPIFNVLMFMSWLSTKRGHLFRGTFFLGLVSGACLWAEVISNKQTSVYLLLCNRCQTLYLLPVYLQNISRPDAALK